MAKRQMHVLTKYFYPVAAGIEANILETYSVLAKMDWDVTIHTTKDNYAQKNVLPDEEMHRGLKIKRYPLNSENTGYFPDIDLKNFDGVLALHNFNVYYWRILFFSLWLKIIGQKRFALVLTPHGGFNPIWDIFPKLVAILKMVYHYVLGTVLINLVVDKVRAVSEWERVEIINKGAAEHKVMTISNGLEDEAFMDVDKTATNDIKRQVKRWGKYLIQIGRIYPVKNYETTIQAMTDLPSDINYVIMGPIQQDAKNKNYKKQLDVLVMKLGLQDRVFFAGVIRGVDKFYVIKHAAMMVHMATWESFCNVVHEGMSQGLVCIVSNVFALPYLIKDGINGYLVSVRDNQTLAKKINFVLDHKNSKTIKAIKDRNVEASKNITWSSVAGKMNKLYASL